MDTFTIADKTFLSRLIVGTGKYSSPAVMVAAHEASGAEMITVAVRRVNIADRTKESLLDYIDTSRYFLLPNTAGCYSADDAVQCASWSTSYMAQFEPHGPPVAVPTLLLAHEASSR